MTKRRLWIALALAIPPAAALLSARPAGPGLDPPSAADLVVTKRAEVFRPASALAVQYTIIAANRGPDAATDVIILDRLPPPARAKNVRSTRGRCDVGQTISCVIPRLNAGDSALIVFNAAFSIGGRHQNQVTASAGSSDPNPANNAATIATPVGVVFVGPPDRRLPWFFYILEPLTAKADKVVRVGYVSTRRATATARIFQAARLVHEDSSAVIQPGRAALRVSDGLPRGSYRIVLNARSASLTRSASAKLTVR